MQSFRVSTTLWLKHRSHISAWPSRTCSSIWIYIQQTTSNHTLRAETDGEAQRLLGLVKLQADARPPADVVAYPSVRLLHSEMFNCLDGGEGLWLAEAANRTHGNTVGRSPSGQNRQKRHASRMARAVRVACWSVRSLAENLRGMQSGNLGVDLLQLLQLLPELSNLALKLIDGVAGRNRRKHKRLATRRRSGLRDSRQHRLRGGGRLGFRRRHRGGRNHPAQHGRRCSRYLWRVGKSRLNLLVEG